MSARRIGLDYKPYRFICYPQHPRKYMSSCTYGLYDIVEVIYKWLTIYVQISRTKDNHLSIKISVLETYAHIVYSD